MTRKAQNLEQKRARARDNQKAYRASQKKRILGARRRVVELKRLIFDSAIYLAFIAQANLLRPCRNSELRYLILNMYVEYFKSGAADPKVNEDWFTKQEAFLSFHISDQLVHPLPGLSTGYKPLLEQWILQRMLYTHFRTSHVRVEQTHPNGDVYQLTLTVTYTISYRMIAALYPAMVNDGEFVRRVVGKELRYQISQLSVFNAENQISSLQLQQKLAEGWLQVLQDPILVAKVLKHTLIDESCYIVATLDRITRLSQLQL